jgi:hypothetical protein
MGRRWNISVGDGAAMRRMDERLKFVHYLGESGVSIVYPLDAGGGRLLAHHGTEKHVFIAYLDGTGQR